MKSNSMSGAFIAILAHILGISSWTHLCFVAHASLEHSILFILSSTGITDVKEHFLWPVTTSDTLKDTFAFADSKPRDELLQSDRIQIVKLTELPSLGGRTRQLQVPD